jgi:hypothetical protein
LYPVLLLLLPAVGTAQTGKRIPRTVLALYDGKEDARIALGPIHRLVEMPLNHLGLVVTYRDIQRGLPSLNELNDVRGVLTWFQSDEMADPIGFLSWAESVVDSGKRFVILGNFGVSQDSKKRPTPQAAINRFFLKLGLRSEGGWRQITYDVKAIYKDPFMVEFERPLDVVLSAFEQVKNIDTRAQSFLIVQRGGDPRMESHLVVAGPAGGYVAPGYTHYSNAEHNRLQWFINPFEFFRIAFGTDDLPKPDTTTLSGRRIFYSHVDGDGWRNLTELAAYRKSKTLSTEVILNEVINAFPELPVTVAPVAADIDPEWLGNSESLRLAKTILALPQVEAGSHTYSHPLNWSAYAGSKRAPETRSFGQVLKTIFSREEQEYGESTAKKGYSSPRSYSQRPFSLTQEVDGSISFINSLLPVGKKVQLLQWSGDTEPFEEAVARTRAAGVRNLNGGDTRFDRDYPSYAWVSPLGREVGKQRQIYASNSNENTYTDMWSDRYFAFQHLVRTIKNTETPLRVKPFNVYYHMYSGQKLSSLTAIVANLRYSRNQEITPIPTSQYAAIADGFYQTQITLLGPQRWRITNRDALQTIRFDQATFRTVDFAGSTGVIGQRHHQGSLYVALDASDPAPVIALKAQPDGSQVSAAEHPYLIHSRFHVWELRRSSDSFSFQTQGFGRGEMAWKVPRAGRFQIEVQRQQGVKHFQATVGKDGVLAFEIGPGPIDSAKVTVKRLGH